MGRFHAFSLFSLLVSLVLAEVWKMKSKSTNIILLNEECKVLLHLRDDKPTILYPNMWVLPGGYIEDGETPEQCVIREMAEELGLELKAVSLFVAAQRSYGFEHTFWARADFCVDDLVLTEGQAIKWFTLDEIRSMKLGYEDNALLEEFFRKKPFASCT
jgi:8-oxo-dGTP diphosphatase